MLLAAITESQVAAWTGVVLAIVAGVVSIVGTIIAAVAMLGVKAAKAYNEINAARLNRQGEDIKTVKSDLTNVALAATPQAVAPAATPALTADEIADAAVKRALEVLAKSRAAVNKPPQA